MPENLIIDEWLWADLNGENGENKQKESLDFLEALFKKCDKIVVAKGSKFQQKEWHFSKGSGYDVIKRKIANFYFSKIRYNPQKYEEVDVSNVGINIKGINPDDLYLIQTYDRIKGIIITTDEKLIEILKTSEIKCNNRDEFFKEYLK